MEESRARSFQTAFPEDLLHAYQKGTLAYTYKGVPCLRNPLDLAISLRLLWQEKPRSIIEIGSKAGGSALLWCDLAATFRLDATVVSIDRRVPSAAPQCAARFLRGDVGDLQAVFAAHDLFTLPRPWLVYEDSAHTYEGCTAALEFFRQCLRHGELLVMEDGVLAELGLSEQYAGGPNRAIAEFFARRPHDFAVATEYTDMFGITATYNPNGYLRRR